MLVKDIMTTTVVSISAQETVEAAAELMLREKIGCLPVFENNKIAGIITESDFIGKMVKIPHGIRSLPQLLGEWFEGVSVEEILLSARKTTVRDVMSRNLIFVNPDTTLTDAVKSMMSHSLVRLPVIDQGKVVGIVARRDILAAFAKLDG